MQTVDIKMVALDLYKNAFTRAILNEAVAEMNQLKINGEPISLIHKDLLQMLRKLNDELSARNSVSVLTRYNNDRQNQSILVQRHLSTRISNDFYLNLLKNPTAVANASKKTTRENILEDYVKINAIKVGVIQRWEEARQEQKKIETEERTESLAMEIDLLNNLVNRVQLCRQKTNLCHANKIKRLQQQIDHWKRSLVSECEKMTTEIREGELRLEHAKQESIDMEEMLKNRQIVIDDFNAEPKPEMEEH